MNLKIAALAFVSVSSPFLLAQDAQQILEGARLAATLTTVEEGLSGNLSGPGKPDVPVTLFLKGENIQFQFKEANEWRVFHMRLNDNAFDLFEIKDGKTTKFPDDKIVQPIAGTDLSYEDLAFRFFYWPNPKLEGQEEVDGMPCYKLRVNKPKGAAGRYETIYIWVHTKFGAFMKIRGHNTQGQLLKEFQVLKVMEIGNGVWTLKKMQVSSYAPGSDKRLSITDVAFETPKKAGPKGLKR
jgi:hypothetical protein